LLPQEFVYVNLIAIAMAAASYHHYRKVLGVWGVQSNWSLPVTVSIHLCVVSVHKSLYSNHSWHRTLSPPHRSLGSIAL